MRDVVLLAASADFCARLRTSSATTAKPLPAEPALAASTAAFRARMFVWNAMSSMVFTICSISSEERSILCMAFTISSISSMPLLRAVSACPTSSAAVCVWSAILWRSFVISATEADSSCTEAACSVAPWESPCAPEETWSAPLFTCSDASLMSLRVELSIPLICLKDRRTFL